MKRPENLIQKIYEEGPNSPEEVDKYDQIVWSYLGTFGYEEDPLVAKKIWPKSYEDVPDVWPEEVKQAWEVGYLFDRWRELEGIII